MLQIDGGRQAGATGASPVTARGAAGATANLAGCVRRLDRAELTFPADAARYELTPACDIRASYASEPTRLRNG